MESPLLTKKFNDGLKKVGPGCKFTYRSVIDPISSEELKILMEREDSARKQK